MLPSGSSERFRRLVFMTGWPWVALTGTLFLLVLFSLPQSVAAQEPVAPSEAVAPNPSATPTPSVPATTAVIKSPIELQPSLPLDVAPFFLSRLEFDGVVIDDRVELSAEIDVEITQDGVWQEVPLRMPEARVIASDHEGAGQQAPVIGADRGDGLTWKFRGQGKHRLFLEIEVPVVRSPAGKRLSLTLPQLPKLYSGKMTLRIPEATLDIQAEGADLSQRAAPNGETLVDVTVPGLAKTNAGARLDLIWSKPTTASPGAVAEVQTEMTAEYDVDESVVRLSARQTIRGIDRTLASVDVIAPRGFDGAMTIQGDRYVEHRVTERSDGRNLVTVLFDDKPAETTTLQWTFERDYDVDDEAMSIDGPEVLAAARHTGTLDLLQPDGHRVTVDWDGLSAATRGVPSRVDVVATVRMFRQPFQVPVRYRRERPSISVVPTTDILVDGAVARLRSNFQVQVDRGKIDELTIEWEGLDTGQWTDLVVEQPVGAEIGLAENVSNAGQSVIRLPTPRTGLVDVVLTGSRRLGNDGLVQFALPHMLAESESDTRLRLFASDSVQLEVDTQGEATLTETDRPFREEPRVDDADGRVIGRYYVTGNNALVDAQWTIRQPEVTLTSTFSLAPVTFPTPFEVGLTVGQTVAVDIQYSRWSDVVLEFPEALTPTGPPGMLADRYTFSLNGAELPRTALEPLDDGAVRIRFPVRMSTFTLGISERQFFLDPVRDDQPGRHQGTVPVVRVRGEDFDGLRCEVSRRGAYVMTPSLPGLAPPSPTDVVDGQLPETAEEDVTLAFNSRWQKSPTSRPETVEWLLIEPPAGLESFDVTVTDAPGRAATFSLTQSEVQITRDRTVVSVRADWLVENASRGLVFGLPSGGREVRFTWNGRTTENNFEVANRTVLTDYVTHRVLTDGEATGRLTIEYRLNKPDPGLFEQLRVPLPKLPDGVWAEQSAVELTLPRSRHILSSPSNLSPLYRWIRHGLVWSRTSLRTLANEPSTTAATMPTGRRYLYEALSTPETVTFVTARGSVLILLGAASTFTIAFLCYRFPQVRSLPVLFGLGVAVAMLGVVDAELLRVLLQPAILGLLLAVLAVAVDRRGHVRRYRSPVMTVVSESDLSAPPSQASRLDSNLSETLLRSSPSATSSSP